MSAHTPLPWHVSVTGDNDQGFPGLTIQSAFGLITRLPEDETSRVAFDPENIANAEYMVRAVNSHPALVGALTDISTRRVVDGCSPQALLRAYYELQDDARAALTAVKTSTP